MKRPVIYTLLMIAGVYGTAYIGTLPTTLWWATPTFVLGAVFTFVCAVGALSSFFLWLDS